MKSCYLLVGVAWFSLSVFSFAQTPTSAPPDTSSIAARKSAAAQLFVVMHLEKTFDQLMAQVDTQNGSMVRSLFPEMEKNPEQKREFDAYMVKVSYLVHSSFSWQVMEPEYEQIYADAYTLDQLNALLTFYKSPLAQLQLEKTPGIMQASSAVATQHMNELTPKVRALMQEEVEKMKAIPAKAQPSK